MRTEKKRKLAQLRHWRVRKKVVGTAERPRMSVCFTGKNIYVQFIDDSEGRTLLGATTVGKQSTEKAKTSANVAGAEKIGKAVAEAAKAKGIETIVFDRGSARYHGKVKALADAAREAGLKF